MATTNGTPTLGSTVLQRKKTFRRIRTAVLQMSQRELARALRVHLQTIKRYESGQRGIRPMVEALLHHELSKRRLPWPK